MLAYVATSSPLLSKGVTIFINMSGTDQMQFFFLKLGGCVNPNKLLSELSTFLFI